MLFVDFEFSILTHKEIYFSRKTKNDRFSLRDEPHTRTRNLGISSNSYFSAVVSRREKERIASLYIHYAAIVRAMAVEISRSSERAFARWKAPRVTSYLREERRRAMTSRVHVHVSSASRIVREISEWRSVPLNIDISVCVHKSTCVCRCTVRLTALVASFIFSNGLKEIDLKRWK